MPAPEASNSAKRKKPYRFDIQKYIDLLKEALAINPWDAKRFSSFKEGCIEIAKNLGHPDIAESTVRDRLTLLLNQYEAKLKVYKSGDGDKDGSSDESDSDEESRQVKQGIPKSTVIQTHMSFFIAF